MHKGQRQSRTRRNTKHGMIASPEYHAWAMAIQRCTNPRHPKWADYGGRGIAVAPEFRHDFPAFYAHVGPRPGPGYSLDRIDNDKGYEPGNLRWADVDTQRRNQHRREREYELGQLTGAAATVRPLARLIFTAREAAEYLGLSYVRVRALIAEGRLKAFRAGRGWAIYESELERFAATPRPTGRPRRKPAQPC